MKSSDKKRRNKSGYWETNGQVPSGIRITVAENAAANLASRPKAYWLAGCGARTQTPLSRRLTEWSGDQTASIMWPTAGDSSYSAQHVSELESAAILNTLNTNLQRESASIIRANPCSTVSHKMSTHGPPLIDGATVINTMENLTRNEPLFPSFCRCDLMCKLHSFWGCAVHHDKILMRWGGLSALWDGPLFF